MWAKFHCRERGKIRQMEPAGFAKEGDPNARKLRHKQRPSARFACSGQAQGRFTRIAQR
jgi:hypothetical protein